MDEEWVDYRKERCFRSWLGWKAWGVRVLHCQRPADRLKEGKGLFCQSKDLRVGHYHHYEQADIIDGH